jgi:hypothetical protein
MKKIIKNLLQDTPAKVSNTIKTLTGSVAFMTAISGHPYLTIGILAVGAIVDSFWPGKK